MINGISELGDEIVLLIFEQASSYPMPLPKRGSSTTGVPHRTAIFVEPLSCIKKILDPLKFVFIPIRLVVLTPPGTFSAHQYRKQPVYILGERARVFTQYYGDLRA
jgi:hypothetical protein